MIADIVTREAKPGSMMMAKLPVDTESDLLKKLDQAEVAGWLMDPDGVVDNCNDKACEILKMPKDEIIGKKMDHEIISSEHREEGSKAMDDAPTRETN